MAQTAHRKPGPAKSGHGAPRRATPPAVSPAAGLPGLVDLLALQRSAGNRAVSRLVENRSPVHDVVASAGRGLAPRIRAEMQDRLGHDFTHVRVHDDARADASARSVGANAYTSGRHVVFRHGQFDTTSHAGKTMLAHELTHVVQQETGPVSATPAGGGIALSDPSDAYERAAERTAERAMRTPLQRDPAPESTVDTPGAGASGGCGRSVQVQRNVGIELEETNWTVTEGKKKQVKGDDGGKHMVGAKVDKSVPIVHRPFFQLQAEYNSADESNIEIVTNAPGVVDRAEWNTMSAGVEELVGELRQHNNSASFCAGELKGGDSRYYLHPGWTYDPFLQMTVGLPLAAVPEFMNSLPETAVERSSRAEAKRLAKMFLTRTPKKKSEGASSSRRKDKEKETEEREGEREDRGVLKRELSPELLAFVLLVRSYLRSGVPGHPTESVTFLKGLTKVMARTDFAAMFMLLPPNERRSIRKHQDRWVQIMTSELAGGQDGPVFGHRIYDSRSGYLPSRLTTTRQEWLDAMIASKSRGGEKAGRDILSVKGKGGSTKTPDYGALAEGVEIGSSQDDVVKPRGDLDWRTATDILSTANLAAETVQQLHGQLVDVYEGFGALGDTHDLIQFEGSSGGPLPAVILEIRNPSGHWAKAMEEVFDAADTAIKNVGGGYTSVLSDKGRELRDSADRKRAAVEEDQARSATGRLFHTLTQAFTTKKI